MMGRRDGLDLTWPRLISLGTTSSSDCSLVQSSAASCEAGVATTLRLVSLKVYRAPVFAGRLSRARPAARLE